MRPPVAGDERRSDAPLVGRTAELGVVERWLSSTADGRPTVGLVSGTAGVGKSRLLRSVIQRATARRFRVLFGSGLEEGTPPLLPMMTALGPLLDQAAAGVRPDLTAEERLLLGLSPPSGPAPAATGDVGAIEADTVARYLAVSRLVLGAARAGPVLLAIDDAHAIDDASAALLAHVVAAAAHAAEGAPVHLLTLVTYRPRAGSTATRRALDRLSREADAQEVSLEGLHEVGLHEYLLSLGPGRPSRSLVRAIMKRTDGNPLFARLLWTYLLESGAAVVDEGRVIVDDPAAAMVARLHLDDVVDLRLERLAPEVLDLLGIAAVAGDGGDLQLVAELAGCQLGRAEELFAVAEEAGICWVEHDRYHFDHPLTVAALSRKFGLRQRRMLHGAIATALAARTPSSALEISAHLRSAGPIADVDERRRWGVIAARQAMELGAWADAAACFDLALDGIDDGFPMEERIRLHLDAARASHADHDLEGCERHASVTIELARSRGDHESWSDAVAVMAHAHIRVIRGGRFASTEALTEFLAAADDAPVGLRARINALIAEVHFAAFEYQQGREYARLARALAAEAGDDELISFVAFAEGLQLQGSLELDEAERCFDDSIRHATSAGSTSTGAWASTRLASTKWLRGEFDEARQLTDEAEASAASIQDWAELSLVVAWQSTVAASQARLADAIRLAERALAFHRRSGYAFSPLLAYPVLCCSLAIRGDAEGALRAVTEWREAGAARQAAQLEVLVATLAGDRRAVEAAIGDGRWRPVNRPPDLGRAAAWLNQVEIGALVGRRDLVVPARAPLADLYDRGVRMAPGSPSSIARLAAVAAGAGGDPVDASRWLEAARRDARIAGAPGELAWCDLTESRLLAEQGDPTGSERARGRAATAFDRLGMLGLLRVAEMTADSTPGAGRRARRIILFTDVVGSMELNAAAGDDTYYQLLRSHDHVVRDMLRAHDGVQFKHTGDGVAAWFNSASQAIDCAFAILDHLVGLTHAQSGMPVSIRCGLSAGEPIESDGDLFGLAVGRAARICALAGTGEVLVGEEVLPLVGADHLRFVRPVDVHLKGLTGTHRLLLAERVPGL